MDPDPGNVPPPRAVDARAREQHLLEETLKYVRAGARYSRAGAWFGGIVTVFTVLMYGHVEPVFVWTKIQQVAIDVTARHAVPSNADTDRSGKRAQRRAIHVLGTMRHTSGQRVRFNGTAGVLNGTAGADALNGTAGVLNGGSGA